MADIERIRAEIADLATRPNGVRFEEIERMVNQLGLAGFDVHSRRAKETVLFRVNEHRFGVSDHNPGRQHVKAVYVKGFLKVMAMLGLHED